jgi:hypothetical protein
VWLRRARSRRVVLLPPLREHFFVGLVFVLGLARKGITLRVPRQKQGTWGSRAVLFVVGRGRRPLGVDFKRGLEQGQPPSKGVGGVGVVGPLALALSLLFLSRPLYVSLCTQPPLQHHHQHQHQHQTCPAPRPSAKGDPRTKQKLLLLLLLQVLSLSLTMPHCGRSSTFDGHAKDHAASIARKADRDGSGRMERHSGTSSHYGTFGVTPSLPVPSLLSPGAPRPLSLHLEAEAVRAMPLALGVRPTSRARAGRAVNEMMRRRTSQSASRQRAPLRRRSLSRSTRKKPTQKRQAPAPRSRPRPKRAGTGAGVTGRTT